MAAIYEVFAKTDAKNRIVAINSSAFVSSDWGIKIDEGTGDKFHHAQNHYLDGPLYTYDNISRYKLAGGKPVERGADEIAADRAAMARTPTAAEQLRADVDFLAAMTGVTL